MNDKLEESVHDNVTLELKNSETVVLTGNCFNFYMVLIFSDLNKAQIYKMPYRDSPHHEIEKTYELYLFELARAKWTHRRLS